MGWQSSEQSLRAIDSAFSLNTGVMALAGMLCVLACPFPTALVLVPAAVSVAFLVRHRAATAFAVGVFVAVVAVWLHPQRPFPENLAAESRQYIAAIEQSRRRQSSQSCIAKVRYGGSFFRARLVVGGTQPVISPGDTIIFTAAMQPAGYNAAIPGMDGIFAADRAQGVVARAFVDPGRMRLAGHDSSSAAVLAEGTNRIAGAIGASGLGDDASSLMAASVLGNYDLPENIDTSFIASGMAHLMCVSGFHVAVVAALIMALLWPLRLWGSRGRWRFLLAVVPVWLYVVATGFGAPAVRAAAMLSVALVARFFFRQSSMLNSLALALVFVLAINPHWIHSAGLQLSVLAILGLYYLGPRLNPVPASRRLLHRLAAPWACSLAVVIATMPLLVSMFHQVSVAGVAANALAGSLFPVFMAIASLATLCSEAGIPNGLFVGAADEMADVIIAISNIATKYPQWIIGGLYPGPAAMAMLCVATVAAAVAIAQRNLRMRLGACILACAMLGMSACTGNRPGPELVLSDSDIIVCESGRATVYTVKRSGVVGGDYSAYFRSRRVVPDSVTVRHVRPCMAVGAHSVLFTDSRYPLSASTAVAPLAILGGKGTTATDEEIAAYGTGVLAVTADIEPGRRRALCDLAAREGAVFYDLASGSCCIGVPLPVQRPAENANNPE